MSPRGDPEFGARLKEALSGAGLSQGEFERQLGVSKGYASRLISGHRGQRIDREIAARMTEILRVDPDWLFYGAVQDGSQTSRSGTPRERPSQVVTWANLENLLSVNSYDPRDVGSVRVLFEGQDDVAPLTWARRLDDARRRREQGLDEAEAERARLERLSRAETPLDEVLRARPELQSVAARFDPHGPRPAIGWLEFLLEEARRETKGKRRR
jgi:transcriptional regulator with XRE-family HTH domain